MFRKLCKLSTAVLVFSAVSLFAAQAAAAQPRASIYVSPSAVVAGNGVTVQGNAGGCPTGDQVTLLSPAFSSANQFADVNAIYATVRGGGNYSTTTQIPSNRPPGLYPVTGRCGGGNLGISTQLTVIAPPTPSPASGISPAIVSGVGLIPTVFYTSVDHSVWASEIGSTAARVSNGTVLGRASAIYIPAMNTPTSANATVIVFGTGTDHALWYAARVNGAWTNWTSLGGIISDPAVVYRGSPQLYSVYARGADGAVWSRDHTRSGWNAWHSLGGLLYPGTGPAAAYAGGTYVLAVGLDKQLYIAHSGVTGFRPVGGRTTANPALTAAGGALIGFARGTDNAAWYHRFIAGSPGWHSMGGIYTSGLGASSGLSSLANTPVTYTVGLGLDSHLWMCHMNWGAYPPSWGWPVSVD
jgi:hypothetical protein